MDLTSVSARVYYFYIEYLVEGEGNGKCDCTLETKGSCGQAGKLMLKVKRNKEIVEKFSQIQPCS